MFQRLKRLLPIIFLPFFMVAGLFVIGRYKSVKHFTVFIGYPRSGHTLVGSLLDAHPDITVSIEANALQMLQLGYYKQALLLYAELWSKFVSVVLGNRWSGYSYKVPGGNQGKTRGCIVMGDNDANQTSQRLMKNPGIAARLESRMGMSIKYIHIIRNPFDIITTMHNRKVGNFSRKTMKTEGDFVDKKVLAKKARGFFRKAKQADKLLRQDELDILNVYHENLIADPKKTLSEILDFLEIEYDQKYLEICATTIHTSSNQSRFKLDWPEKHKRQVSEQISSIPFLKGYTFADGNFKTG